VPDRDSRAVRPAARCRPISPGSARQRDPLALPTGHLAGPVRCVVLQPDLAQRLGHCPLSLHPVEPAPLQREPDISGDRHVRPQRVRLEHDADVTIFGCDKAPCPGDHVCAKSHGARLWPVESGEHAQQRRLAAAGWAEHDKELTRRDRHADLIQCAKIAEFADHIIEIDVHADHGSTRRAVAGRSTVSPASMKTSARHNTETAAASAIFPPSFNEKISTPMVS